MAQRSSELSNYEYWESMKDSLFSDEDYNLWVLLSRTRDAIFKCRQRELNKYNISVRKAVVLHIIQVIGNKATPSEIGRWLLREDHSVSELVMRMEREGLVKKVKDLDKKNQVRIVPTEKGLEAYHQSAKREPIHKIMPCLSEKERQQLMLCLWKLRNKALKELGIEYDIPFPPQ